MDIGLAPFERNMICSQYKAFQTQTKGIKRNAVFTEAVLHGSRSSRKYNAALQNVITAFVTNLT
ncbi:hypothetical protein FS764_18070 [Agrobacterium vitis]|uniref:hypothetical protein n=1 Tax=Agrobacterium vitis TaxID=373 RepID=UPI0015DA6D64|nr:hypothetical protein [Agrobacterium vitis]MCF1451907.1 hypothetical protein [Agrobacterium vitis]MCF1468812.1 hypothetical protein [Agrobacterium vitis]BCH53067.1 hypothetical protein RvVAR031_06770 [Agrobacterium vitis]